MKIVYLVPGLMPEAECRRREAMLRAWAAPGARVDVAAVSEGPSSIESVYEEFLSVPATAQLAMEKEREGYDAAILGCAGDPGLHAIRELCVRMAVFGPGEASFLAASMLGYRFGVITPAGDMSRSNLELAFRAGARDKYAASLSTGVPVLDMMKDKDHAFEQVLDASRRLVLNERVDTLILGCMTLAFLDISEKLSLALGLPVINPASLTLRMTEAFIACNLAPSKAAFPLPPKLASGKAASFEDLFGRD